MSPSLSSLFSLHLVRARVKRYGAAESMSEFVSTGMHLTLARRARCARLVRAIRATIKREFMAHGFSDYVQRLARVLDRVRRYPFTRSTLAKWY